MGEKPAHHVTLDNWIRYVGPVRTPNGAPCEKCGRPSVWILKAREFKKGDSTDKRYTLPIDDAPEHPRCADHLYPGCASTIDGA